MTQSAIIIGTPSTCRQVERQLDLLDDPPAVDGWILAGDAHASGQSRCVLGGTSDLERVLAERRTVLALVCLPAAMTDLITTVRTRLRRLGVADRFLPTLDDQLAGVGPRTELEVDPTALLDRPSHGFDEGSARDVIAGRRVLITGAGGSIGGELARIAQALDPSELILVDRSENSLFEIDRQIARRAPALRRTALLHDVVDAAGLLAHFRRLQPQVIFHAAAHKHVPMMEDHPGAAVDNNVFGTKFTADAAHAVGADRFVMISTDKAVNPASVMGATKRMAEMYVQELNRRSDTAFSMVRFGNVLGSTGSVLDVWRRQIAEGGPLTITDPRMTRYFMTIAEAARLVVQSAALVDPTAADGEVFVLDMGDPVRILDLASRFVAAHGLILRDPGDPTPAAMTGVLDLLITGARPGEKLHEELARDVDALLPTRSPSINIWMLPAADRRYIENTLARLDPSRRPADPRRLAATIRSLISTNTAPATA